MKLPVRMLPDGTDWVPAWRVREYEELRQVVAAMWDSVENDTGPSSLEKDMEWEHRWSQVSDLLRRLEDAA